jgi:hypothetical protein
VRVLGNSTGIRDPKEKILGTTSMGKRQRILY